MQRLADAKRNGPDYQKDQEINRIRITPEPQGVQGKHEVVVSEESPEEQCQESGTEPAQPCGKQRGAKEKRERNLSRTKEWAEDKSGRQTQPPLE